jgi:hypothetical protein
MRFEYDINDTYVEISFGMLMRVNRIFGMRSSFTAFDAAHRPKILPQDFLLLGYSGSLRPELGHCVLKHMSVAAPHWR